VERVKTELRALKQINQKREGIERRALAKRANQTKPTPTPPKSRPAGPAEPYGKCEKTNNTTSECRVATTKYMWYGSPEHLIAFCTVRLKDVDKGAAKPLAPPL